MKTNISLFIIALTVSFVANSKETNIETKENNLATKCQVSIGMSSKDITTHITFKWSDSENKWIETHETANVVQFKDTRIDFSKCSKE